MKYLEYQSYVIIKYIIMNILIIIIIYHLCNKILENNLTLNQYKLILFFSELSKINK